MSSAVNARIAWPTPIQMPTFLPIMRLLSEDDSDALQAASNLARMRRSKQELVDLIDRDPPERELQVWFEGHPWIFGSEYVAKEDRRRFGIDTEGDFVMRSADDFIDIFELKKASAPVLRWDASHNTWTPTRDLAEAIGQALKYAEALDDHKFILRDQFDLPVVYPRVRVVIGRSHDWDEDRRRRSPASACAPHRDRGSDLRPDPRPRRRDDRPPRGIARDRGSVADARL